jgi:hypothetical protein
MLVFLRFKGSASIRGVAPRKSCLLLKPARIINRNLESIPGQLSTVVAPASLAGVMSILRIMFLFTLKLLRETPV